METLNRIDKALRDKQNKEQLLYTLDEVSRNTTKEQRQHILGENIEQKLDRMNLKDLKNVYEEVHRKVMI